MINIVVWSKDYVDIDGKSYEIVSKEDMEGIIKIILDKAYYSGERLCLESAVINEVEGKAEFTEIERWK